MVLNSRIHASEPALTLWKTESPRDRPYVVCGRATGFRADYNFGEGACCLGLVPGA